MHLSRDHRPPKPGPKMEFWTPRNIQPEHVICVSRQIVAHHVHWLGSRTAPCEAPTANCTHCERNCPTRWKGYLHVLTLDAREERFLCLTPGAGYALLDGKDVESYSLRGKKLEVYRSGKSPTSLLIVRVDPLFINHGELRPELDPAPFLDNVFRKVKPLAEPN